MKSSIVLGLAVVLTAGLLSPAYAEIKLQIPTVATQMPSGATVGYVKLAGVNGGATAAGHAGEIEITGVSMGETQTGSFSAGGGGGAGKISVQDVHFAKRVDLSSPALFLGCAQGLHYSSAVVTIDNASAGYGVRYTLTDVLISSFQQGSMAAGSAAEEFSLNVAKIRVEVIRGGAVIASGGWDVKGNKAL